MSLRVAILYTMLLLSLSGYAQVVSEPDFYSSKNNRENLHFNGWALTYSPSAFLNNFPGIQFGVEKSISQNNFLEFEAAYLYKIRGTTELSKTGYRFKLGYKLVSRENFLFSTVLYFRKTFHQHREEVLRQDEFLQEIEYRKTKTLIGPTIGIGRTNDLADRLHLETSLLFGPGLYKVRVYDYPEDAEEIREGFFGGYRNEGNYYYPIIGFSLKLVYRLG